MSWFLPSGQREGLAIYRMLFSFVLVPGIHLELRMLIEIFFYLFVCNDFVGTLQKKMDFQNLYLIGLILAQPFTMPCHSTPSEFCFEVSLASFTSLIFSICFAIIKRTKCLTPPPPPKSCTWLKSSWSGPFVKAIHDYV